MKRDHWISVQEMFAQKVPFSTNSDTIGTIMNIMQLIDAMINKTLVMNFMTKARYVYSKLRFGR